MAQWQPRDAVLVRYAEDPALWHWRGILEPRGAGIYLVVSPDREVFTLDLERIGADKRLLAVKEFNEGRLPRGLVRRRCYLPEDCDEGPFSEDDWRRLLPRRAVPAAGGAAPPRWRMRVKQPPPVEAPLPVEDEDLTPRDTAPRAPPGPGAASSSTRLPPPWEVPPGNEHGGQRVPVPGGDSWYVVAPAGEDRVGRRLEANEVEVELQDGCLYRYGGAVGFARYGSGASPELPLEADVRVLPIQFDRSEERWRSMGECFDEGTEEDFPDWPLQGPRSTAYVMRTLKRDQLNFLTHSDEWARKSGVGSGSRSVHEHKTLSRALHLLASYDQVNLMNLAGAEVLVKRRALIEHAHHGRPDNPVWDWSEDFMGVMESPDGSVVDPAVLAHQAARMSAKTEVMKQARKAREEGRPKAAQHQPAKQSKGGGKGAAEGAAAT